MATLNTYKTVSHTTNTKGAPNSGVERNTICYIVLIFFKHDMILISSRRQFCSNLIDLAYAHNHWGKTKASVMILQNSVIT